MKSSTLLLGLSLIFLISSCQKNNLKDKESSFRTDFITQKSDIQIKNDYLLLEEESRKRLWLEKLEQLTEENLPKNVKTEVLNLISVIEENNFSPRLLENSRLLQAATKLVDIVPEEDFLKMFNTLEDYTYNGKFVGNSKCAYCLGDIKYPKVLEELSSEDGNIKVRKQHPRCNCRWTCGGALGETVYCTHSECTPTDSGCGFLWTQPCEERDEIDASKCPSAAG